MVTDIGEGDKGAEKSPSVLLRAHVFMPFTVLLAIPSGS